MILNGDLILQQAKLFYEQLKTKTPGNYTRGWLHRFKTWHVLKQLKICSNKKSADSNADENFVEVFDFIKNQNPTAKQIYNADETALCWKYMPIKIVVTVCETGVSGFKYNKECVTLLGCANAAGLHRLKLAFIGKNKKPRSLQNIKKLPVSYHANKSAWINRPLFVDWYDKVFVPQAKKHCKSIGLPSDCIIILMLDNCFTHPPTATLIHGNIRVMYLPPNITSIPQPMNQGIICSLKCKYWQTFL